MCYRPSWVAGPTDQVNTGKCPNCGMPVAASIGITAGKCPHCGKAVTMDALCPLTEKDFPGQNKPIL